jgi:hypothetical protein
MDCPFTTPTLRRTVRKIKERRLEPRKEEEFLRKNNPLIVRMLSLLGGTLILKSCNFMF